MLFWGQLVKVWREVEGYNSRCARLQAIASNWAILWCCVWVKQSTKWHRRSGGPLPWKTVVFRGLSCWVAWRSRDVGDALTSGATMQRGETTMFCEVYSVKVWPDWITLLINLLMACVWPSKVVNCHTRSRFNSDWIGCHRSVGGQRVGYPK